MTWPLRLAAVSSAADALPHVRQPQPARGPLLRLLRGPRSRLRSRSPEPAAVAADAAARRRPGADRRPLPGRGLPRPRRAQARLPRPRHRGRRARGRGRALRDRGRRGDGARPGAPRGAGDGQARRAPAHRQRLRLGRGRRRALHRQRVRRRRRRRRGLLDDCAEGASSTSSSALAIAERRLPGARARALARDRPPRPQAGNVWLGDDGAARLGDFGLAPPIAARAPRSRACSSAPSPTCRPSRRWAASSDAALGPLLARRDALRDARGPSRRSSARTRSAIIGQHLNAEPVAPSWHRPEVPPALDELVLEPAREGARRPAAERRRGAARRSSRRGAPLDRRREPEPRSENPLEALAGGVFVGRERELERDARRARGRARRAGPAGAARRRARASARRAPPSELGTYARVRGARCTGAAATRARARRRTGRGSRRCARYVARGRPGRAALAARAAAPRTSPRSCPSSRERLGDVGEPPRLEHRAGALPALRLRRRPSSATPRRRGRWCSSSTTSTGPTSRRCCCCSSSPASSPTRGCSSIGTYRDVELGRHHPLAATLAELPRDEQRRRIALRGLDADGDRPLHRDHRRRRRPPPDLADAVHDQTEGNPFFIGEVVRLLASRGPARRGRRARARSTIPQGVREVVGRRLDRLSDAANEVLRHRRGRAGASSDLDVLEQVAGPRAPEIEAALDEAVDGAARRRVGRGAGALRFSTRSCARRSRPRSRRRGACACTSGSAEALEAVYADDARRAISASSPTTSSRRRPRATSSAPSTTRPGPPTRPRAGSPTRTRRCCTPRRSTRSSSPPEPDRRAPARAPARAR